MLRCNVTILLVAVFTIVTVNTTICTLGVAQSANRATSRAVEYYSRPDLKPPEREESGIRLGNVSLDRPAPVPTLARPRSSEFETDQHSHRAIPGRLVPPGRSHQGRPTVGATRTQRHKPSFVPDQTLPPIMELRVASPGRGLPPIVQSSQQATLERPVLQSTTNTRSAIQPRGPLQGSVHGASHESDVRLPEYQPPAQSVTLSPSKVNHAITLTAAPTGQQTETHRFNSDQQSFSRTHQPLHLSEPIASDFDSMRSNVSRATIVFEGGATHAAAHPTFDAVPLHSPTIAAVPQQDPQTQPTSPPTSVVNELNARVSGAQRLDAVVDPFAHLPQNLALPREFPDFPQDTSGGASSSQPVISPLDAGESFGAEPPKPQLSVNAMDHPARLSTGNGSGSMHDSRQSWKSRTILPRGFGAERFDRNDQRWRAALHRKQNRRHQPLEQAFNVSGASNEDCGCATELKTSDFAPLHHRARPFETNCCTSTFYLSVFGGYTQLEESTLDPVFNFLIVGPRRGGNLEVDDGFGIGIALGQIQGKNLRSELEFTFRHNDVSAFDFESNPLFPAPPLSTEVQLDGSVESFSGMVNFVWDFQPRPWFNHFRPYAGGGVGFTFFDTRVALANGADAIAAGFNTDSSFAYQLMAGVSRPLRNKMDAFVEYRYFSADSFRLQLNLPNSVGGSIDYDTENIFFGIRKFF